MLDYQVGDKVIHPSYGLGEIVCLDEKIIHEQKTLCYEVRVRDLTIWVKADGTAKGSLRRPTQDRDLEKMFAILKSQGEELPIDPYDRKALLNERMKDGKLASICGVIRDLIQFQGVKKLNDHDKIIMERAKTFLFAEWMYSRSASLEEVRAELKQLLE